MQTDMRDRLIELIRQSHCVEIWDYWNDELKQPNPIEALANHLITNGLIVPPCKVGETVYCLVPVGCKLSVEKGFVREFRITGEKVCANIVDCEYIKFANLNINVSYDDFGKTVFLTKEQAEQKLKETRNENG